ncbi:hypothetical protein D6817_01170 [Candidatus Pacearchaeota archaeon]|nr:MAG: hypothetical protein D6817_01170 [Candidatus Pacearchaeota archaeon]
MTNGRMGFNMLHEESEVEKKLKVRFLPPNKEPFRYYIGRRVEIISSLGVARGVYRGTTEQGQVVLQPHIKECYYPDKSRRCYETKDPQFIRYEAVTSMTPLPKNLWNKWANARRGPENRTNGSS